MTAHSHSGEGTILFGGSGFLGSRILALAPRMISVGRTKPDAPNEHIAIESVADLSALRGRRFDRVIFAIGNSDRPGLDRDEVPAGEPNAYHYHTLPLLDAFEQLKAHPIRSFVRFSTIHIYDMSRATLPVSEDAPIDPYRSRHAFSNHLGDEASRYYSRRFPIVTVRLSNMYGPARGRRYDLVNAIVTQILATGRAEVMSLEPARDFVYADDVADAALGLTRVETPCTVNVGSGEATSVRRVVEILRAASGAPIVSLERAVEGPMRFQCDIRAIGRLTGWRPRVGIEEGLRRTYEQMKAWSAA